MKSRVSRPLRHHASARRGPAIRAARTLARAGNAGQSPARPLSASRAIERALETAAPHERKAQSTAKANGANAHETSYGRMTPREHET